MEYSKSRILGLANGTCEPVTGLEKHFVMVCQGQAKPASNIEREWLEIVHSASESLGGASSDHLSDLAAENQRLSDELISVTARMEVLKNVGNEKDTTLYNLRESVEQLKSSLRDVKNTQKATETDLVNATSQLAEAQLKITTLERSIEQKVEERLPIATRDVLDQNLKIREVNNKIADQNQLLVDELRKFIPARLKCEICDGVGKWVDKGTVRVGADYDGPNAVDICTNCRGAGFIDNPKREELGIKPMVKP